MIPLRLPKDHPNSPVIQRWATDKETIIGQHTRDITDIQKILKQILEKVK